MVNIRDEIFKYQAINLNSLLEGSNSLSENEKNSIILYNKAITNIKMGSEDIAIIELKKAIAINSNFIDAMVLLGLCYMEIRDYSKALDTLNRVLSVDVGNIRAQEYCSIIKQKDPRLVMERKKASSRSETGNPPAARTMSEKQRRSQDQAEQKNAPDTNTVKDNSVHGGPLNKTGGNTYGSTGSSTAGSSMAGSRYGSTGGNLYGGSSRINYNLRKYITGMVLGIVLACLVLIPALMRVSSISNEVKAFKTEQNSTEAKSGAVPGEIEAEIEKLNSRIKDLNKQIENQNSELTYYRTASKLSQIRILNRNGDFETAADQLLEMKNVAFNGSEKAEYEALCQEVFSKAAFKVSNEGSELYGQKKYSEAINKLKKIEIYNPKFDYLNGALYVLGRCYQDSGDIKNAEATYRKVITGFPNTENARYAQMRLNEMGIR